jgi:hypothetical protein
VKLDDRCDGGDLIPLHRGNSIPQRPRQLDSAATAALA